jgi:hypothetical protein
MSDVPVTLYIATYADPGAAQDDWDGIKQLARDEVIAVDGLVLVSRDAGGKIEVKDDAHDGSGSHDRRGWRRDRRPHLPAGFPGVGRRRRRDRRRGRRDPRPQGEERDQGGRRRGSSARKLGHHRAV